MPQLPPWRRSARAGAGGAVHARPHEHRLRPQPVRAGLRWPRARRAPAASSTRTPRWRRTSPSIRPMPTTSSPSGSRTAGTTAARMATSPATPPTAARPGRSAPPRSRAAPAASGDTGGYERATDPWLSYGPNGRLHAIAIAFDNSTRAQRDPRRLLRQRRRHLERAADRALRQSAGDRQQLQRQGDADRRPVQLATSSTRPGSASSRRASGRRPRLRELRRSFFSETWFARSTNGGVSWEPARAIFADRGRPADDRQPGRGAAGRNADQRLQPDPGGHQPARHARLQRGAHPVDRQGRDLVATRSSSTACSSTRCTDPDDRATTSAPATSSPTGRSTAARTRPRAGTSTWSGWTPASTIPTTTTSCSPGPPTAGSPGARRSSSTSTPRGRRRVHRHGRRRRHRARRGAATTTSATTSRRRRALDRLLGHALPRRRPDVPGREPAHHRPRSTCAPRPTPLGYFVGDYTGLAHFGTDVPPALGRSQRRQPRQPHRRLPPHRGLTPHEAAATRCRGGLDTGKQKPRIGPGASGRERGRAKR